MQKFKVLITEDEPPALRMIKKIVEQKDGYAVAAAVKSAEEALECVEMLKPDLLITDIRMGGMDGLELAEKARNIKPDLVVIIISGYQKFEYAARALKLGIEEYLLKPIDPVEINAVLGRVYNKLIHMRDDKKGYTLRKLLSNKNINGVKNLYNSEKLNILTVNQSGERANLLESCLQAASVFYDVRVNVAVWQKNIIFIEECVPGVKKEHGMDDIRRWLIKQCDVKTITLITANGVDTDSLDVMLPELYRQSREERVLGKCVEEIYSADRKKYFKNRTEYRLEQVITGNLEKDKIKFQDMLTMCEKNDYTTRELISLIYEFTDSMSQFYSFMMPMSLLTEDLADAIRFSDSYGEVRVSTWEIIENAISKKLIGNAQRKIDIRRLYDNMVAHIQSHPYENLSLKEIAAKFHVSQPYVSKAFRECANTSYKEYVIKQKIRYAIEIIRDNPDAMIKDIADQVGIEQSYFSTFFYRETGKNPSDFKNDHDTAE